MANGMAINHVIQGVRWSRHDFLSCGARFAGKEGGAYSSDQVPARPLLLQAPGK